MYIIYFIYMILDLTLPLLNHKIYSAYMGKRYIRLILVVTCFPRLSNLPEIIQFWVAEHQLGKPDLSDFWACDFEQCATPHRCKQNNVKSK